MGKVNVGRVRGHIEDIILEEESDGIISDDPFLLFKDFCNDVSSAEEEINIPSRLLEREKSQEMFHDIIRKIIFGFGGSSHPSDYTAFVVSDYIKKWTQNWLKQKSKWT